MGNQRSTTAKGKPSLSGPFGEFETNLGAADQCAAGQAHAPREHPGNERRELPPQAEQAQTQPSTRPQNPSMLFLTERLGACGVFRYGLNPIRRARPQASAPDTARPANP